MSEQLVTIASFATGHEASIVRGLLESNGIPVFLADENISRIGNHLTPIIGGIKLQVRSEDEQMVRELLSQVRSEANID